MGTATLINAYTMYVSALGSWSAGTHTAAIFDASAKPVLMGGDQITITGGGGPGRGATTPTVATGNFSSTATTLTRTDGGSWLTDGFVYGQVLQIGPSPAWKIKSVTDTTITVDGPPIGSTAGMSVQGFSPSPLVLAGTEAHRSARSPPPGPSCTMRTRPARSVTKSRPSGARSTAHGARSPDATSCTFSTTAVTWGVGPHAFKPFETSGEYVPEQLKFEVVSQDGRLLPNTVLRL